MNTKKKLSLKELNVNSFVTTTSNKENETVQGQNATTALSVTFSYLTTAASISLVSVGVSELAKCVQPGSGDNLRTHIAQVLCDAVDYTEQLFNTSIFACGLDTDPNQ